MVWPALAATTALSAIGGISAKSGQTKARRAHRARTRAQIGYSEREQAPLFDERERLAKSREENVREGYSGARRELDKASYQARREVMDREEQSRAQVGQTLLGLEGTSAINAYRGLSGATSRQLANVDRELGNLYAGLTERETQAVDRARGALDRFYQSKQDFLGRNRDIVRSAVAGGQPGPAQAPDLGGLAELFMAFSGGFGSQGDSSPAVGEPGSPYYGPPE